MTIFSDLASHCSIADAGGGASLGMTSAIVGGGADPQKIVTRDAPVRGALALFLGEGCHSTDARSGGRKVAVRGAPLRGRPALLPGEGCRDAGVHSGGRPDPASSPFLGEAHEGPTTVVMRNVPVRCNVANLQATVKASGFEGRFEYLYLPVKKQDMSQNRGYVLVRFASRRVAQEFCSAVGGCRVNGRQSAKAIQVDVSQANIPLRCLSTADDMDIFELVGGRFGPMARGSAIL